MARCFGEGDPLYEAYHDDEWGFPVHDERGLFEKVCLEGMQAGLSWRLVLGRREQLRVAFAGFDPDALCTWGPVELASVIAAPGVIRSAAKCAMVVRNAVATVGLRASGGLAELVWSYAPPPQPPAETFADVPTQTEGSKSLAKALKKAGFTFVGPVSAYSLMQADGLVNDHLAGCPVRARVEAVRRTAR